MISETAIIPTVTARLFLLVTMLLALLPHLFRLPWIISVVSIAMIIWRMGYELKDWPLPGRILKMLLVLIAISVIANEYHSIVGRVPGVALLTLLLSLKLIEIRTLRDTLITIFISYFLITTTFLFNQSIYMGVYLFVVALLLTTTLIALNHTHTSTREIKNYFRHGAVMMLQALPIMLALFILFPRINGPLWALNDKDKGAVTGLSETMTMGNITDLAESDAIAFRVNFEGDIPPAKNLYWRSNVLWNTNGPSWFRLQFSKRNPRVVNFLQTQWISASAEYTIIFEPHQQTSLVALDLPSTRPTGINGNYRIHPDYQLELDQPLTQKVQYRLRSYQNYSQHNLADWEWGAGLQLPKNLNPQSIKLARQWRSQTQSDVELINTALDYFRTEPFYYTRKPPALYANVVDMFLFETRQGFCEHYAASFVTLMRAADIPARVVIGYQGAERNPIGNYLIVRQSNAHAWAEVWLDDRGWVRIDPTAVIPPERVLQDSDTQRFNTVDDPLFDIPQSALLSRTLYKLRNQWDALNHQWNQWVVGFNQERQQQLLKRLGLTDFKWGWSIAIILGLIFPILMVLVISYYRHRPATDPLLKHFKILCKKLQDAGVPIRDHDSPQTIALRVANQLPMHEQAIEKITRHYHKLRYGNLANEKSTKLFIKEIRNFKP